MGFTGKLTGPVLGLAFSLNAAAAEEQAVEQPLQRQVMPELNFYGLPGLMDMPNAEQMPDGELAFTISNFAGMTRGTLAFQVLPRVIGTFRYSGLQNWNADGFSTYYDRSFDLSFQLLKESDWVPAVTLGIRDFVGTGLYSGEYVVASKTFDEKLTITAGLGWGRLASHGAFASTGMRKELTPAETEQGGQPNWDVWFRGDVAMFGGVAWRPIDKLTLKAEYSSDAYDREAGENGLFDVKSQVNFGAEYQFAPDIRLGAYAMYGSEFGLTAQFNTNPARPPVPGGNEPAPPPVLERPSREEAPEFYTTTWTESEQVRTTVRTSLYDELLQQGIELEALTLTGTAATAYIRNGGFQAPAQAFGRTSRLMSRIMPSSVETFTIVLTNNGMELPAITFTRSDVEFYETQPDGAEQMLARAEVDTAPMDPPRDDFLPGVYPRFNWAIGPYLRTSLFDPDNPLRADLGIQLNAGYTPAPGVFLGGTVQKKVVGNLDTVKRESNSVLPHVRSDYGLYDKYGDPAIRDLFGAYYFRPSSEWYGRLTAGLLERMHGGVSAELLWSPYNLPYAIGFELNHTRQRDYDGGFGFLDYEVTTGYASLYYRFAEQFFGQVDVGRYLAGDYGATFSLDRVFQNGWRVGAFATFTDVSPADFGEGSFDKGIHLTIPLDWLLARPTRHVSDFTIRPVTRDGGAKLIVPGRLFGVTEDGRRYRQEDQWGRFWR